MTGVRFCTSYALGRSINIMTWALHLDADVCNKQKKIVMWVYYYKSQAVGEISVAKSISIKISSGPSGMKDAEIYLSFCMPVHPLSFRLFYLITGKVVGGDWLHPRGETTAKFA